MIGLNAKLLSYMVGAEIFICAKINVQEHLKVLEFQDIVHFWAFFAAQMEINPLFELNVA